MKIYTKTGDRGMTHFYGGKSIRKDHPVVECYGAVDELNALLGLATSLEPKSPLAPLLQTLQNHLFELGADLSAPFEEDAPISKGVIRVTAERVSWLESTIDQKFEKLSPLQNFILPGGTPLAAILHYARAVCRRSERLLVAAMKRHPLNPVALIYLNRFSDLLFVLARAANDQEGVKEVVWKAK